MGRTGLFKTPTKILQTPFPSLWHRKIRCQVQILAEEGVDMLSMMTVTNLKEAIAAVTVAREFNLPIHVSFSVETDGRLPGGRTLEDVIREVDSQTENYTTYFGVNCAHPRHIVAALRGTSEEVRLRIGSIRGNASLKSPAELDNALVLDRGDVSTYVQEFDELLNMLPEHKVGGCCGTDEEHLDTLARRVNSLGGEMSTTEGRMWCSEGRLHVSGSCQSRLRGRLGYSNN